MHDFACSDPDDMVTEALADRVRYLKRSEEGVEKMSKVFEEVLDEMRTETEARGMERSMEKGMEAGVEKGRLQALFELVRDGALPLQAAAGRAGMTSDAFAARACEGQGAGSSCASYLIVNVNFLLPEKLP